MACKIAIWVALNVIKQCYPIPQYHSDPSSPADPPVIIPDLPRLQSECGVKHRYLFVPIISHQEDR